MKYIISYQENGDILLESVLENPGAERRLIILKPQEFYTIIRYPMLTKEQMVEELFQNNKSKGKKYFEDTVEAVLEIMGVEE